MPSYVATCTLVFSEVFHSIMWFQKHNKGCVLTTVKTGKLCAA